MHLKKHWGLGLKTHHLRFTPTRHAVWLDDQNVSQALKLHFDNPNYGKKLCVRIELERTNGVFFGVSARYHTISSCGKIG